MTSSTISPLRRIAATLATVGAIGVGAVAVAPAALADDSAPATPVAAPASVSTYIQAPLPAGPIPVVIGKITVVLPPKAAQVINTIEANLYVAEGYLVNFTANGELVYGKKPCDPNKPADQQKNCVPVTASRF
jgi:hypothetical protein